MNDLNVSVAYFFYKLHVNWSLLIIHMRKNIFLLIHSFSFFSFSFSFLPISLPHSFMKNQNQWMFYDSKNRVIFWMIYFTWIYMYMFLLRRLSINKLLLYVGEWINKWEMKFSSRTIGIHMDVKECQTELILFCKIFYTRCVFGQFLLICWITNVRVFYFQKKKTCLKLYQMFSEFKLKSRP